MKPKPPRWLVYQGDVEMFRQVRVIRAETWWDARLLLGTNAYSIEYIVSREK